MRLRVTLVSPAAAASPALPESRTATTPATVGDVRLQPQQHQSSAWHSPVASLFGGLAAMLGLIAFALLILASSYWKLSGYVDDGASENDTVSGEGSKAAESGWENNVLVIMAGQVMPTFLATPSTSRSSTFGDTSITSSGSGSSAQSGESGKREKAVAELSEAVEVVGGRGGGGG